MKVLALSALAGLWPSIVCAATVLETKEFSYSLLPNDVVHEALKCSAGELISGGFSSGNTGQKLIMVSDHPYESAGVRYWRVDLRNISDTTITGFFTIHVVCSN